MTDSAVSTASRRRVLLVDDDEDVKRFLRTVFSKWKQVQQLEASNGLEAVERLLSETVDLVVLDLNMPRMNGFEVASFIRNNPATINTTIAMFTTETATWARRRSRGLGNTHFFPKPFDPIEFSRVMKLLLKL